VDKLLEEGEERAIAEETVQNYAESVGAKVEPLLIYIEIEYLLCRDKVFETSAKTGQNVEALFFQVSEVSLMSISRLLTTLQWRSDR